MTDKKLKVILICLSIGVVLSLGLSLCGAAKGCMRKKMMKGHCPKTEMVCEEKGEQKGEPAFMNSPQFQSLTEEEKAAKIEEWNSLSDEEKKEMMSNMKGRKGKGPDRRME